MDWAWVQVGASLLSHTVKMDGLGPSLTPCGALVNRDSPLGGPEGGGWAWQPQLTVGVHTHDEVVAHGPCLAQLVRMAIMHHVIAVGRAEY